MTIRARIAALRRNSADAHPHALLQNAAQYLAEQFTRTASFRSRGVLMPWQHEALAIIEARRKASQ